MPTPVLDRSAKSLPGQPTNVEPVVIEEGSIRFAPHRMEVGRYYFIELDGRPYLYRRINDDEVEIYGVAD